jgi:hypothetical protein
VVDFSPLETLKNKIKDKGIYNGRKKITYKNQAKKI